MEEESIEIFRKKLKKLRQFKGRGTEMISLYIPEDADRSQIMGQITEELSQSSNIKSPQTRKNVQGALRKINTFLKNINFKIPKNGLVLFCGNVSETEGRSDIKMFPFNPIKPLKTKLYWCDSSFHLDPLEEMQKTKEVYALIVIDKREATVGLLKGKKYDIIGHFTSNVAGKQRAGGQSALRFERLREEATQDFFKRTSEKINAIFEEHGENLKGMIVGGPGITKNKFLEKDALDYRLKEKIIGTLDTSYTDESGIREMIQKSEELLKDTALMKERALLNKFMEEIVKDGLVAYGEKEVMQALEIGKAEMILLSEGIEWTAIRFQCIGCTNIEEIVIKDSKIKPKIECKKCDSNKIEELEELEFAEFMEEKAKNIGAKVKVISVESPEGEQFLKGFGGIGAFLRYK
ncbi:peptide chain release factor aRF-1 [Candidatus Micrarchaeota archaeon]|nr:peptide chain release factor aRF-1 [Candidatus Micrarchaeota archaeon]MBU2476020.1 peptide chain release factor aRF-1 [Candidatus Micrarchaeota archaeon]